MEATEITLTFDREVSDTFVDFIMRQIAADAELQGASVSFAAEVVELEEAGDGQAD